MNEAERTMQNVEAEEALLGAVIGGGAGMEDTIVSLPAEDFVLVKGQEIWKSAFRLFNEGQAIDYLTIADDLERHGKLEMVGGLAYLTQLSARVPPIAGVPAYADMVRDAASRRKVIRAATEMAAMAYKASPNVGADEMLARAAAMLEEAGRFLPASYGPEVISVADLCSMPIPEHPWLINNYIVDNGLNLLAGQPGSGKSWLAMDAALAVSVTGSAWGGNSTSAGNVLYLAADSPQADAQRRFKKLCMGRGILPPANVHLHFDPLALSDPLAMMQVENMVKAHEPRLIVLDAIARYMGSYDENSAADVGRLMAGFRKLSSETNSSLLILHHWRKSGQGAMIERARGSGDFVGAVDSAIYTKASGRGSVVSRTMMQVKLRGKRESDPLAFGIEDSNGGGITLSFAAAAQEVAASSLVDASLDVLISTLSGSPDVTFSTSDLKSVLEDQHLGIKRTTSQAVFKTLKEMQPVHNERIGKENFYKWVTDQDQPQ